MKLHSLALPLCGFALCLACVAQTTSTQTTQTPQVTPATHTGQGSGASVYASDTSEETGTARRSFLVAKDGKNLTFNGDWRGAERLNVYAKAHPGTYILFVENGSLHRLDAPAKIAEAERLYEPSRELGAQQAALGARQRPLGEQQAALGAQQGALGQQMRAAASPRDMGAIGRTQGVIGHEQGIVGRAQGAIGREQGVIGRQQGIEGRRYYEQMQTMLDGCVKDGSCPVVSETGA